MHDVLRFSKKTSCLPVVHGSGDFAIEVRRVMLSHKFDCLAVPLPGSFQRLVEEGIGQLPNITIVVQEETDPFSMENWSPESPQGTHREFSYVPIDPCQPVVAGIRLAIQEHIPRAFIDLEVEHFEARGAILPDPYALKQVPLEKYSAAVLPSSAPPLTEQHRGRVRWMARRLRELERVYGSILFICSVSDWPWIRDAYRGQAPREPGDEHAGDVLDEPAGGGLFRDVSGTLCGSRAIARNPPPEEPAVHEADIYRVEPATLLFLLGELPFITSLYEAARYSLDDDENLSVDGVKEMLLSARQKYRDELKNRGRNITPKLLSNYLKYVRNLCLVEKRMTPDLYTLIVAAKQIAGDQFAISLAEVAREYKFSDWLPYEEFKMSIGRGQLPNGDVVQMKSRLPGHPVNWRNCELRNKPPEIDKQQWAMRWNPFTHCSWPPEDVAIERFRTHVKDRALSIMGNDLAKVEKFTTSLKDGLDIRETLRNWHTGDLYVKEMPPSRGSLDCVMMLFDSPADPREYPWRITWHAEHQDESTLSFFSTHFSEELVGPGIALALM